MRRQRPFPRAREVFGVIIPTAGDVGATSSVAGRGDKRATTPPRNRQQSIFYKAAQAGGREPRASTSVQGAVGWRKRAAFTLRSYCGCYRLGVAVCKAVAPAPIVFFKCPRNSFFLASGGLCHADRQHCAISRYLRTGRPRSSVAGHHPLFVRSGIRIGKGGDRPRHHHSFQPRPP